MLDVCTAFLGLGSLVFFIEEVFEGAEEVAAEVAFFLLGSADAVFEELGDEVVNEILGVVAGVAFPNEEGNQRFIVALAEFGESGLSAGIISRGLGDDGPAGGVEVMGGNAHSG